jgi:hypothetical protein
MESCLLFHGPGARQAVIEEAGRQGRLLHEPFGDSGLKVDEARLFASLLQSVPLGIDRGIVIAGPMDKALPKSADALLHCIEEFHEYVWPMLWSLDLGGVRNTIRSRCLDRWCPATGYEPIDEEVEETARELLSAALSGNYASVPTLVAKMKAVASKKQPGREYELLCEVADAMTAQLANPKVLPMWERVRDVLQWRNPTQIEVMTAFLSGPV